MKWSGGLEPLWKVVRDPARRSVFIDEVGFLAENGRGSVVMGWSR